MNTPLFLLGAGNMCKAICGVAAGACNSAINLHWAKGSDISDINAKFGAQHTITGALGLFFAALFARSVSSVPSSVLWTLYASLTFLHIFANMRCVRLIAFDYLNTERMNILVNDFLTNMNDFDHERKKDVMDETIISIDTPVSISKRESLFFIPSLLSKWRKIPIRIGLSFDEVMRILERQKDSKSMLNTFVTQLSSEKFVIICDNKEIIVVFSHNVDPIIKAKAYFSACLIRNSLYMPNGLKQKQKSSSVEITPLVQVNEELYLEAERLWSIFTQNLSRVGWDLTKTDLYTEGFCIAIEDMEM